MNKPKRKRIRVDELEVYAQSQRKLKPNWAKEIADTFTEEALGSFIVSARGTHYYVVDGQHRLEAMLLLNRGASTVDCLVYEDLTVPQEAALFLKYNNSKLVKAIDKFHVRITAGDPDAIAIKKIIDKRGVSIVEGGHKKKETSAVGALDKIYSGKVRNGGTSLTGPALLEQTLDCLIDAWEDDSSAFNGQLMQGVAAFLSQYWNELDADRLSRVMKSYKGGATGLARNAKALRDIRRISPVGSYAGILVDAYNSGLRSRQLEDWGR